MEHFFSTLEITIYVQIISKLEISKLNSGSFSQCDCNFICTLHEGDVPAYHHPHPTRPYLSPPPSASVRSSDTGLSRGSRSSAGAPSACEGPGTWSRLKNWRTASGAVPGPGRWGLKFKRRRTSKWRGLSLCRSFKNGVEYHWRKIYYLVNRMTNKLKALFKFPSIISDLSFE